MVRRNQEVYSAGLALETNEGVYEEPNVFLPFSKLGIKPNVVDEDLAVNIGTPGATFTYRKDAQPGGPLSMPAWPEAGLEQLLKMAFGAVQTTRNIPDTGLSYTHAFTQNSAVMPTATIIRWADAIAAAKEPEAYLGLMLNSLQLGYDGPGPISLQADLKGTQFDLSQSAPTKTYTTAQPFVWGNFSMELDGSALAHTTKASIKIDKIVDSLPIGGAGFPRVNTPTGFKVGGRLEFPYETWDELKNYIAGSTGGTSIGTIIKDRTMKLTCIGANIETTHNYKMEFKLPRVNMKVLDNDKDTDKTEMYGFDWAANLYQGIDAGLGTNLIASASVVSKLATIT